LHYDPIFYEWEELLLSLIASRIASKDFFYLINVYPSDASLVLIIAFYRFGLLEKRKTIKAIIRTTVVSVERHRHGAVKYFSRPPWGTVVVHFFAQSIFSMT